MKTVCLKILTFVLLMAFVEVAAAEEEMRRARLIERLIELDSMSVRASRNFDFKKELELASEEEVLLSQIDVPRPMSLSDLKLHINDLKKIITFNESQIMLVKKNRKYLIDANSEISRENYDLAIVYCHKSLKISDQLYGSTSMRSLNIKTNLAHMYSLTNKFQAGINHVTEVKQVLQENRNDSKLYLEASITEYNLYHYNGEAMKAMNQGMQLLKLLEETNGEKTDRYYDIQGRVASQLNKQNRHKEAREHARKSLNLKLPISKSNVLFYVRLFHVYAVASIGLNDNEKAAQGFSELIRITAGIPNYSLSERVDFMEEYVPVLRKLGRDQEAEQMEEKIKRMRFDLPLQKSRFTD